MPEIGAEKRISAFEQWFKENGGYLHPQVRFAHNDKSGYHCRATAELDLETLIFSVPHSLALSRLNALVDESFAVFKNASSELAVEVIGYFYLMHQYLHKAQSFWESYLDILPQPHDELRTPLWFDDSDRAWLEDTDVLNSYVSRKAMNESQYEKGIKILSQAEIDTQPYTWDLFKWAVTIFTSRAFSSRALHPQESKYWTAYRMGIQRQRQTILIDMSHTPAEDLDFPVLFPGIDVPNHRHDVRIDWNFDPGRFTITGKDAMVTDAEVCNNYGPKSNDELLLGYGFCITDNPNDAVLLTLKPPHQALQQDICRGNPGYLTSKGTWNSEKATFGLKRMKAGSSDPAGIFEQIPESLLELMMYILRYERGLSFNFSQEPLKYILPGDGKTSRYLPHLSRMIVLSLVQKLDKIQSSTPAAEPRNYKQVQAEIYRDGQTQILESIINCFRGYSRSLFRSNPGDGPQLLTMEGLLQVLNSIGGKNNTNDFLEGIAANAGTTNVDQLRLAGWEDDVLVLLICFIHLQATKCEERNAWVRNLPEYIASRKDLCHPSEAVENTGFGLDQEEIEQARSLLEIVHVAAQVQEVTLWSDPRWNDSFIAGLGGRFLKFESFMMMVPVKANDSKIFDQDRLVVYLHGRD